MDWNLVISGVIGLIAGGGVSWLFKLREDKASSKADVVDKSTDAMDKMMNFIGKQQEEFNKIIADKDEVIRQQGEIIAGYKVSLDEAKSNLDQALVEIREHKYKGAERDRKIEGMQKVLTKEVSKKKYAESRICLVEDCKMRQPEKDTFNSDDK